MHSIYILRDLLRLVVESASCVSRDRHRHRDSKHRHRSRSRDRSHKHHRDSSSHKHDSKDRSRKHDRHDRYCLKSSLQPKISYASDILPLRVVANFCTNVVGILISIRTGMTGVSHTQMPQT